MAFLILRPKHPTHLLGEQYLSAIPRTSREMSLLFFYKETTNLPLNLRYGSNTPHPIIKKKHEGFLARLFTSLKMVA